MEATSVRSTGEVLADVSALLDAVDHDGRRLATDTDLLGMLQAAVQVAGRCTALAQRLAGEVVRAEAAEHAHGTGAASWLADTTRLTRREASALLYAGRDLEAFPHLAAATIDGAVLPQQARSISRVLIDLPDDLPAGAVCEAEQLMVGYAGQFNSAELATLSRRLLEVLAPDVAEESDAQRLEREHELAVRNRYLQFHHDGHGTTDLKGSLPTVDAELLIRLVDAHAAQQKRALEALDPHQTVPSRGQRRADGLMALVHAHSQQALAPSQGGDRPRVVVLLDYDKLHKKCVDAGLLGAGEQVAASVLRKLACDADVLPAVLGGASEPLDVGRTQRLVTGPIRAALEARDRGCAFPGCDKAPADCHAHHIRPWWNGGHTALSNLVLVCPHHHGIVEPPHQPTIHRWEIRLRDDGLPEVLPPDYVDRQRRPRQHARFRLRSGRDPGSSPG
ncbi:MAG: DUF222 domain-containing protein [Propionicimonas sp.]|uniref:HNH endonuclease signature motif containing protein n=1 Tax=Propionicimonas sp. TaxID=1955623 RepID=UPI003D10DDE0